MFGMPLHAEHEAIAGCFDRFDYSVVGPGADAQALAGGGDSLVVSAVHREVGRPQNFGQLREKFQSGEIPPDRYLTE